jgi:hypothetical protein
MSVAARAFSPRPETLVLTRRSRVPRSWPACRSSQPGNSPVSLVAAVIRSRRLPALACSATPVSTTRPPAASSSPAMIATGTEIEASQGLAQPPSFNGGRVGARCMHQRKVPRVVLRFEGADGQRGLSSAEVAARARRFGLNKLAAGKAEPRGPPRRDPARQVPARPEPQPPERRPRFCSPPPRRLSRLWPSRRPPPHPLRHAGASLRVGKYSRVPCPRLADLITDGPSNRA